MLGISCEDFITGSYSVADPKDYYADPDPAITFDANLDPDTDPAPHQSDANLRPLVYRPSTAPLYMTQVLRFRIRLDHIFFRKSDPDPNQSHKKPHQTQNSGAVWAQNRAMDGRGCSHWMHGALLKKKRKFSSYIRNSEWIGCKVIYD